MCVIYRILAFLENNIIIKKIYVKDKNILFGMFFIMKIIS